MAVWTTTPAPASAYTDTSTPDLNASTLGISFQVTVSGGNVNLEAVTSSAPGPWAVFAGARVIF